MVVSNVTVTVGLGGGTHEQAPLFGRVMYHALLITMKG
jgi:hypothetical protein